MKTKKQGHDIYFIYKIINLKNNKIYIGKSYDGENRLATHITNAFSSNTEQNMECPKLYRSIRKYRIENFKLELMNFFNDEDVAYDAEYFYTVIFDTVKNGMNTVYGGQGAKSGEHNPMFGKGHLISGEKNGMYGRTGELNPFFGKSHSEAIIKTIKLKNRILSDENIITIKEMIFNKINYELIAKQFNIGIVTVHRIKTGERYADIGPKYNFHKHNKNISDEEVEYIFRLWLTNPVIKNNMIYTEKFWEENVKDKFNFSRAALGGVIRGEKWKHIYNKVLGIPSD